MSFDFFSAYATDENLENNGTQFPFNGGFLLIARAGNRAYSKALTAAVESRRVELDADDSGKVSDEIMTDVMARTILLGWTGPVVDGVQTAFQFKGADLTYSTDSAKTLLAMREFRKAVAALSDQMDAYKVKAEVATGNG